MNNTTNITIHEMGLSDSAGAAILYNAETSAMRTLIQGIQHAHGEPVRCETADRMAERLGRPDLIKIDVEGAEKMVLGGARHLLNQVPPILIVEYWTPADVAHAKATFPQYSFVQIDRLNWLMIPAQERSGNG